MTSIDYDVAVLGAGSAGAAAALFLARSGRRVALLDARPFRFGGARWVDDVPPWMFDRAGLPRPVPPEKRCDHRPLTLAAWRGDQRVSVGPRPIWGIDMPAFTQHLREDSVAQGVDPFEIVSLHHVLESRGRPAELHFDGRMLGGDARSHRLRARLFVDASGMRQALLRRTSRLSPICPALAPSEICSATQQVREIVDRAGALTFLERHRIGYGHVLSFMGSRGGFSSLMVHVEADGERVEILAGATDTGPTGTGPLLLREFLAAHPWIGRFVFGGSARIPIRRPYDRFAAEGVALLGDAACQTFPAHGSGVGSGLVAARMLADAVQPFDDPGCPEAMWTYQATFQRERGGVHAAYDVLRRASQRLDEPTVAALMEHGLINATNTWFTLNQQIPALPPKEVARMARGAASLRVRSAPLIASAARMPLIRRVYASYPLTPGERTLHAWARAAAALCGHRPDTQRPEGLPA